MHNHDDKSSSSMMWMMAICCLFPLIVLVPTVGKWLSGRYLWLILIVGFVVVHFWILKGHQSKKNDHIATDDKPKSENGEVDEKDEGNQSHGGHCH